MRLVSTYRLLTRFGEFASAELYEGGHRDSMTIERNAEGCLLGLACGDALGRPVEFKEHRGDRITARRSNGDARSRHARPATGDDY